MNAAGLVRPPGLQCAARAALAAAALLLVTSCSGLGSSGSAPPVPYEEVKGNVDRAYNDVSQAINGGTFDRVPDLCTALSAELDRAETASKGWGILEREKMNLALASARHGIEDVSRTAPAAGDPSLLQAELKPVGDAVQQVESLLEQAAQATKSPS